MGRAFALGLTLALATGCAGVVRSPPEHAEAPQVRATVDATFAAMRDHDVKALRALVAPGAIIVRIADGPDGPAAHTIVSDQDFIDGTAGDTRVTIDERVLEPAAVRVEGDVATAWAPYDVRVDGERHHCGIDAIQLARLAGGWRITAITYTVVDCDGSTHPP